MRIFRVYVEKKEKFDIEARRIQSELKELLHMTKLQKVSILNCYDVSGISEAVYEKARYTIFSEPQSDIIYEENLPEVVGHMFAVTYLSGQYDQRADSCMQSIRILESTLSPIVKTSKVYILEGDLTNEEICKIKKHLINPIDSEEMSLEKPATLEMVCNLKNNIPIIEKFVQFTPTELEVFREEEGLAMSREDLIYFQNYFVTQNRNPSYTELKVVDTYWSDHCRHTTFMTKLTAIEFSENVPSNPIKQTLEEYFLMREYLNRHKEICLMDMATIGVKYLKAKGGLQELVESAEINACTIEAKVKVDETEDTYLVLFKNETHNHPTEIEPFGGAATCLGGAIRDPLSGRAYVYQAMRVTGAANPLRPIEETLPGKLPQCVLTKTAANGYSSYGNQIGLATGEVREYYHEGYQAKRLEVGAVVGAVKKDNVKREEPMPGDIILLIGGATGRDGCGGATGSSKEHTEDSLRECGSEVQKGNPVEERKLQRLFRIPEFSKRIKRCNDFGAGGVCVAIGEIAEGLEIDLDQVPVKYQGLDGTELAISESQERMAIAIEAKDEVYMKEICASENLSSVTVATVTEEKKLVMVWKGKKIVSLNRDFLDSAGVTQERKAIIEVPQFKEEEKELTKETVFETLQDLNVASQKGLGMQFDSTIGAGSVLMPFGGKNQMTKELGMVAKIPVLEGETSVSTYMTHGFDPYLSEISPFHGALYAVVESVAKLVALGADYKNTYLSFQEYFERLGEDAKKWGKPVAALLGALKAQKELEIGAIGGKDSMSGTFENISVPPTLIAFTCNVGDAKHCISGALKAPGNKLIYVSIPSDQDHMPDFEFMKKAYSKIHKMALKHQIQSAYAIGMGGVVAALTQMAIGNEIGVEVALKEHHIKPFEKSYGDLILEVSETVAEALEEDGFVTIGSTNATHTMCLDGVCYTTSQAISHMLRPLEKVFPLPVDAKEIPTDATYTGKKMIYIAKNTITKPKVVIPVFPGTNCERDTKRAFERAGAEVCEVLFLNQSEQSIKDSMNRLEKAIRETQIVAFPGGFSAGDEPDGSGKFIATAFRNEQLKEAMHYHLNVHDGLVLGICNGFQVLVKLGLLPYGEVRQMTKECPTLTYNTIGRHISMLAKTKITSCNSPWLANVTLGETYEIPVSHGEGRFVAPKEVLMELHRNGQIFSQYVDSKGLVTSAGNINGSMDNIEGIVSGDGKIIGKMGHSERCGNDIHQNVPGKKNQKIFEAGVQYYKG
ncbi:MAG: phosphoribosylformylglycinamidine synthase [Cellulosilyticaceae bacterium]